MDAVSEEIRTTLKHEIDLTMEWQMKELMTGYPVLLPGRISS
jgi:hypothetical protein